jgi:hypothetical protein
MRRLTAVAMLALVLSGCGGSGSGDGVSEATQVSAVVLRYFSASARGSATELCPLLTASAQETMVEVVVSDERELGRPSTVHTCLQAVRFFGRIPQEENTKILATSLTGAKATVTVKVGSLQAGSVLLSRTAAGWMISTLPGAA